MTTPKIFVLADRVVTRWEDGGTNDPADLAQHVADVAAESGTDAVVLWPAVAGLLAELYVEVTRDERDWVHR